MKFETSIKEIIPRTADTTSFRFPRPAVFDFKPGQYMLTTIKTPDGKELMHPFSISSSPTDAEFIEFTKKLTQSEYSQSLRAMKPGDWARIDGPYGKFTCECEIEKILLLAGGIGITPFFSIMKYCTDRHLATNMLLLYGVKNENDIAFREQLEEMQQANSNLKVIFVAEKPGPAWGGKTGFITAELVKQVVPDFKDRMFFACGPPGMVTAMQKLVAALQIPETQLKLETLVGHT